MKRKLNKSDSILKWRREFDIYLAKCFPKATGKIREIAWIKFCVRKGFHNLPTEYDKKTTC